MPVNAIFVIYDRDLRMPLFDQRAEPYDLPPEGSRYWKADKPYTVHRLDEGSDPPHIHLVLDRERLQAVADRLPEDWQVLASRSSSDGTWHANVVGPGGYDHMRGHGHHPDDADEAVEAALDDAGL